MGQYYKLVNIDDQQYLHPHELGSGLKLMELSSGSAGPGMALMALLRGDIRGKQPWFGKRIVITGDYADEGRFVPPEYAAENLYSVAGEHYASVTKLAQEICALFESPNYFNLAIQHFGSCDWSDYIDPASAALLDTDNWKQSVADFDDFLDLLGLVPCDNLEEFNSDFSRNMRMHAILARAGIPSAQVVGLNADESGDIKVASIEVDRQRQGSKAYGDTTKTTVHLVFPNTLETLFGQLGITAKQFNDYKAKRQASAHAD